MIRRINPGSKPGHIFHWAFGEIAVQKHEMAGDHVRGNTEVSAALSVRTSVGTVVFTAMQMADSNIEVELR